MNHLFTPQQRPLSLHMTDPLSAMAEFEQILLSNSGEDAFDSALKLLSAKLVDELDQVTGAQAKFRQHDTAEETHKAISDLFAEAIKRWPLLSSGSTELGISPPHLVRSIRPLLGWNLRQSDLSWLDATLERLVARDSKGAFGQYFTPREIINLCVDVLNPQPSDLIIDPACGSGGFLFEAVKHSLTEFGGVPRCLGIDFSAKSVKIAMLLAAATHEQAITITKANSLDGRAYQEQIPAEWTDFLCQENASSTYRAKSWGAWNQLGGDVVLTNPPFAGDIDEYEMLDAYEAQLEQSSKKAVSREHLFLERAVDLLRPGGRLAIIVPQGILANATSAYLRAWLLRKCRVIAVVGLHQNAFMPYTGVKTAILFLEKPRTGEILSADYPILFAISRDSGKDNSGKKAGHADYPQIATALKSFVAEQGFKWADSSATKTHNSAVIELVKLSETVSKGRLDAEHYDPEIRAIERGLSSLSSERIGHAVETKVARFKRKSYREITYVDISSVDRRTGLTFPDTIAASDAPSRASYLLQKGDVLVSTVRPDRNVVAIMTENEHPAVASNGFCVLRAKEIPPELLFAYCKTHAFTKMLAMHATASMYPTVSDKDVLNIPFLRPPKDIQDNVVELVQTGLAMIEQAQKQIQSAIEIMDKCVYAKKE